MNCYLYFIQKRRISPGGGELSLSVYPTMGNRPPRNEKNDKSPGGMPGGGNCWNWTIHKLTLWVRPFAPSHTEMKLSDNGAENDSPAEKRRRNDSEGWVGKRQKYTGQPREANSLTTMPRSRSQWNPSPVLELFHLRAKGWTQGREERKTYMRMPRNPQVCPLSRGKNHIWQQRFWKRRSLSSFFSSFQSFPSPDFSLGTSPEESGL